MAPNTADIRRFLTDLFSDEELTTLCFDYFPEVYNGFASGMSKGQKILALLDYCRRREQFTELLKILQQERPDQYAARLGQADSPVPITPSSPQPSAPAAPGATSNVSGGVNLSGDKVSVGNDVVGRDKLIQAETYIEHATIIQSEASVTEITPPAKPRSRFVKAPRSDDTSTMPGVIWLNDAANQCVVGGVEFVRIPAGMFLMGSQDLNPLVEFDQEKPQLPIEIPYAYWMARFPVTNDQFTSFVHERPDYITTAARTGGYSPVAGKALKGVDWQHPLDLDSDLQAKHDHPVVQVSWYDAGEYGRWLTGKLNPAWSNLIVRLPTEAEWEKAARGENGNEWPWGNTFNPANCNSKEGGQEGTTPVGAYSPYGDSQYGAADMIGNVWEWCHSLYKPYPYKLDKEHENELSVRDRELRGGSFYDLRQYARCAFRYYLGPAACSFNIGFRVVIAPPLPG